MVCGKAVVEAGSVTCGAVSCIAWLGDGGASQPTVAKEIRKRLALAASGMDVEIESFMDELMAWWAKNKTIECAECCRPAASEESNPSLRRGDPPRLR